MTESWRSRITIEPGKRGGRPCIRGMRITVYDVLSYLAAGMSVPEILDDFPYLTQDDIEACIEFAAERDFEKEVQLLSSSEKFRRFLDGRSKEPATISLEEYRKSLG